MESQRHGLEFLETVIKLIDLLAPLARGGKAGLVGGAGVGKTILLLELIGARFAALEMRRHFLPLPGHARRPLDYN